MTKVLIVDDSRIGRTAIRSVVLSDPTLTIVGEAANGEDALAMTKELAPDVVLLASTLSDIGSFSLTRLLRRRHPNLRIILLSTFDSDEYRREAQVSGAVGYLIKDQVAGNLNETIFRVAP